MNFQDIKYKISIIHHQAC